MYRRVWTSCQFDTFYKYIYILYIRIHICMYIYMIYVIDDNILYIHINIYMYIHIYIYIKVRVSSILHTCVWTQAIISLYFYVSSIVLDDYYKGTFPANVALVYTVSGTLIMNLLNCKVHRIASNCGKLVPVSNCIGIHWEICGLWPHWIIDEGSLMYRNTVTRVPQPHRQPSNMPRDLSGGWIYQTRRLIQLIFFDYFSVQQVPTFAVVRQIDTF